MSLRSLFCATAITLIALTTSSCDKARNAYIQNQTTSGMTGIYSRASMAGLMYFAETRQPPPSIEELAIFTKKLNLPFIAAEYGRLEFHKINDDEMIMVCHAVGDSPGSKTSLINISGAPQE